MSADLRTNKKQDAMKTERRRENVTGNFGSRLQPGQEGFTLIELSIVLVIIGLTSGGVSIRQNLIHSHNVASI